jgi:trans-2,3-dihydro-3-hydroxyanthranilate isomerase
MAQRSRKLSYVGLDVFTTKRLEGNQLAVFTDARDLSGAEMQLIAKEMNLSETTFILPRDPQVEREKGVRVRIFTTAEELPFAGHPTLGTATVIRGNSGAAQVLLDLNVGPIPVTFREDSNGTAFGEMRQRDPEFGSMHLRDQVARAVGLSPDDIDPNFPVQTVSTGVPFVIVPIRKLQTIQKLRFSPAIADDYLQKTDGKLFYFVCRETTQPNAQIHSRMIFYNGEDPATGSAAGCAAGWMVAHGVAAPGASVEVEQGVEMNRRSRIVVRADQVDNKVVNVRVGGNAVEVMRGELYL